jgi:phenylacetaldehyde dehydrogenase
MGDILDLVPPRTQGARSLLDGGGRRLLFIGGEWREPLSGRWLVALDPATGRPLTEIADADERDVDRAVRAARAAYPAWRAMPPAARAAVLRRIGDLIEAHIDELAEIETLDQGKPLGVARWAELPGAAAQFHFFAGQAMAIEGRTITPSITYQPAGKHVQAWTVREPVGVVGAITPWNSPLILAVMKVAPALAAGCCVVLKPAEDTSLTALRLADLCQEAGLPAGALNIVTGRGAVAGAALAAHPDVDKIAFTGSTATGRQIVDASKRNLKRISLELGGKSPAIVLPDADLDLAIPGVANGIFFNAGQVCVAASRAYVHSAVYDRVLEGLASAADSLILGHGLNPATTMGPLVSVVQADRVEGFIKGAAADGGSVVAGGERSGQNGTFIAPAVVADVHPQMRIVREEVFGPVIVVQRFDDLAEVVDQAHDSDYGFAASLDPIPLARPSPVRPDSSRHGLDQLPRHVRRQPAHRRRQAVGLRARQRRCRP